MGFRLSNKQRWRAAVYGGVALIVLGVSLSGCAESLFYHPTREATPAPVDLVPQASKCTFTSADGTVLCGWFMPAASGSPREAATVVHMHGNAGSMLGHRFFVDWLPARGFNVFMFDYRGYGESEGSARMREGLIEDAHAALKAVRARNDVDPARIAVFAQSLGGAIAAVTLAEDAKTGGDVRALVLESPFASWRDVAANAVGGDPPNFIGATVAWLLIRDETGSVPRPEDAVRTLSCPVLVVHGDRDSIVPVSHGRRMAAAAASGTCEVYAGAQHNSLQESNPEARVRIVEFLRANTGAGLGSAPVQAK
jgi:alpha-beta hydrolase superfamily lysophospholipase